MYTPMGKPPLLRWQSSVEKLDGPRTGLLHLGYPASKSAGESWSRGGCVPTTLSRAFPQSGSKTLDADTQFFCTVFLPGRAL
jgi:hypothetical protein